MRLLVDDHQSRGHSRRGQHRHGRRRRGRARQHDRAGDLRHRPAHRRADLDARHLERQRQRARLPVAALLRRHRAGRTSPGATSEGYELAGADVGATVRLLVTATNPDGASSRASAPTATVKAAPPVNTASPTVTGATLRGTTLSASKGTWTGPALSYAYQWQRDGVDIAGATGATYTLVVADVNASVRVRVTATNADASVTATSLAVGPVRGWGADQHGAADDLRHRQAHRHPDRDARRLGRDRERVRLPVAAPRLRRDAVHRRRGRDRQDLHARLRRRRRPAAPEGHRDQPRRHAQRDQRPTSTVTTAAPRNVTLPIRQRHGQGRRHPGRRGGRLDPGGRRLRLHLAAGRRRRRHAARATRSRPRTPAGRCG